MPAKPNNAGSLPAAPAGQAGGAPDIVLLPYVQLPDGHMSVPDEYLFVLYHRLVQEGTLQVVFASGEVRQARDLILLYNNPTVFPVFVFLNDDIAGICWLNNLSGQSGLAHFCLLKPTWGRTTQAIGERVMAYWWGLKAPGEAPLLRVLIGLIPAANAKAQRFIERLGWNRLGRIPYLISGADAMINYIVRPDLRGEQEAAHGLGRTSDRDRRHGGGADEGR